VNLAAITVRFILFFAASGANIASDELGNKDVFNDYRSLAESAKLVRLLHALNAVLLWGKAVKYLRHMPMIRDLLRTVWSSFALVCPFMVMFLLGFVGFAVSYCIGFGDKIEELSTVSSTFVYLCRAFLMDVKLIPVYDMAPMFGAFMILLFYVTLLLVACNILFAIIADSLFKAKYDMTENQRIAEKALHEGEPVEEVYREVRKKVVRIMRLYMPGVYRRLVKSRKVAGGRASVAEDGRRGSKLSALEDEGGPSRRTSKAAMALEDRQGKRRSMAGSKEPASLMDQGPGMSPSDSGYGEDSEGDDGYNLPTKEELMRAIEHMSGRVLSEISIVGIEIKSELHDVCERVAQMQMAVEELTWRSEKVRLEQETNMN